MTQEKHTPAPWVKNGDFIESQDGYWICALDTEPIHKIDYGETEQANARLIAAAPELLEAAQGLLLWIADETIKRRLEGREDCAPVKAALAAIAKARGE